MDKYKAMGLSDNQAGLKTGKEMRGLGCYPKTSMIVARRLGRAEAADATNRNKNALFKIVKGEMESGIFYDIEQRE